MTGILSAVTLSACEGGGKYPSFAGTYELKMADENPRYAGKRDWPYDVRVPESIRVIQNVFGPTPDDNFQLAIESSDGNVPGKIGIFTFDSSPTQELTLLPAMAWEDWTSPLISLIRGEGRACRYSLSANFEVTLKPGVVSLANLYTKELKTSTGVSYMAAPWERESLPDPDVKAWAKETVELTLKFSASKDQTVNPEFGCDETLDRSGTHSVTAQYERVIEDQEVDLRWEAPPELTQEISRIRAEESALPLIYPLPETALGLLEVFGR